MTGLDLFHPQHPDWVDSDAAAPDVFREQMPQLSWDKVAVRERTLPFYPGTRLMLLRGADWAPPNLYLYALQKEGAIHPLLGQSSPIRAFNAEGNLSLTAETVTSYLRFFGFFVRGEEGPFYIIANLNASYLPTGLRQGTSDEALASVRGDFESRYQSPRAFGKSSDGKWRCSATVMYSNAIFIADFLVQAGGIVEMVHDTPILAGLPGKIWAPIAPASESNATVH